MMLTVQEAFDQLFAEDIIKNIETLRRWLRAGKIPNAHIHSKKEGWKIPQDSITTIIQEKKLTNNQSDYKKGFQDGFQKATSHYRKKTKQLILDGIHEKDIVISRHDFRNLVELTAKPDIRQELLLFSDDFLFQFGVRRPRMKLTCTYLDNWAYFQTEDILFDLSKNHDDTQNKEQVILEALLTYLTKEFNSH